MVDTITNVSPSSLMRLLQLVSPALPIGAFAYSQGLETAVERGWVRDAAGAESWIAGLLQHSVATLDVPVFARLYAGCENEDAAAVASWNSFILASRGTAELHAEDKNLGAALMKVLLTLAPEATNHYLKPFTAYVAAFAAACVQFEIPRDNAALAFVFAWAENQVSAAVRLVPLGQSDGQRILMNLTHCLETSVARGLVLSDDDISSSVPGHTMASAYHETQYSRLFRS
jgi:urease accessory protein